MPQATKILMTGRTVGAEEDERIGLISRKVSGAVLMATAMGTARQMIAKSTAGFRLTKEVMNQNIDAQSLETAIEMENRNQIIGLVSDILTANELIDRIIKEADAILSGRLCAFVRK